MATADKLNKILETKQAIKQAIRDKGVYIGDHDAFAEYPDAIRSIETSSGEGSSDEFFNLRTQNGTNFNYLFHGYSGSELDLSGWDTSNVTSMKKMFENCLNLQTLNISNFNTENVTDMNYMFSGCSSLTALDLSSFNTNSSLDVGGMFNYCTGLKTLNISNFNLSQIGLHSILSDCHALETLRLDNCDNTTINKIITSYDFPTGLIDGITRKMYVNPDNIDNLRIPDGWVFVHYETGEEIEIEDSIIYIQGEFKKNTDITEVNTLVTNEHTDLSDMFDGCTNLTTINGIDQWDTSNVTKMGSFLSGMFRNCSSLTSLDLSSFNTSNVTTILNMFSGCSNLTELDLSNFNLDKAGGSTSSAFKNCNALHTLRLDNCDNKTIYNIINLSGLPTGDVNIDGIIDTRKMYVQEANITHPDNQDERLTAPDGWEFVYVE